MRWTIAITLLMIAAPAWSFDGKYEGQATFVIGNRYCPTQGPALKFEVSQDGKVVGGVRTQIKAVPFNGPVGPDGKLNASYKASADSDQVTIDAVVSDARIEGFTQSPSCRYKISFARE